jgi:hypothetical protein
MVRVRGDVLPDALWGSTAGAHAFSGRSEHDKNIAHYLHTRLEAVRYPQKVQQNLF